MGFSGCLHGSVHRSPNGGRYKESPATERRKIRLLGRGRGSGKIRPFSTFELKLLADNFRSRTVGMPLPLNSIGLWIRTVA